MDRVGTDVDRVLTQLRERLGGKPVVLTYPLAEVEPRHGLVTVPGSAPLAELFGYTLLLRSLTQGRGSCVLEPAAFRPVSRR